jgi:hypothetical protein
MKGIFISYRRQDAAGYAGRLYDRLAAHFGADRVFMDVEGIEPGLDFVDAIGRAVASCEVLIVIIGPGWLATDSAGKRRLDDPKDFVRIETRAALARHIRVVPVLVDKAVMPLAEELPADLAPLVRRQAVELSHKYWDATSAELIRTLERVLDGDKAAGGPKTPAASTPPREPEDATLMVVRTRHLRRFWVVGGAFALIAAAVGLFVIRPWQPEVAKSDSAAGAGPPKTVTAQSSDTTAPPAKPSAVQVAPPPVSEKPPEAPPEKVASPPKEKTSAPAEHKAAPSTDEKTTPAKGTTEKTVPAKTAPEKTAPPKTAPEKPPTEKIAAAKTAPEKTATEKIPPAKVDAPETPPTIEKPAAPAAAAPETKAPVAPPVATPSPLPATLPRIGDSWEYRMRSKWTTVPVRTYTHQVTAVSAREVAQTMSVGASADSAAVRQAFTPGSRWVEWRGPGLYLLEFNPFLGAFGALQNATAITDLPAMPPENPMYGNWVTRGKIRGSESVTVPAGTFQAIKIEMDSTRAPIESAGGQSREPIRTVLTVWYAPEVKRTVKMLRVVLTPTGAHLDEDTYELVKYRVQ